MCEKIEYIKAVLNARLEIVIRAKKYSDSVSDREYYQGKAEGYQQAIDLLSETDESIKVEL